MREGKPQGVTTRVEDDVMRSRAAKYYRARITTNRRIRYDQPTNLGVCAAVGESRGKLHASASVMATKAAQRRKKWQIPDHTSATIALRQRRSCSWQVFSGEGERESDAACVNAHEQKKAWMKCRFDSRRACKGQSRA